MRWERGLHIEGLCVVKVSTPNAQLFTVSCSVCMILGCVGRGSGAGGVGLFG